MRRGPATWSSWRTALTAVAVSRLLWLGIFIAVLAIDFPKTPLLTGIHDHLVAQINLAVNLIQQHLAQNLEVDFHILPIHEDFSDGQPDRAKVLLFLPSRPNDPE